MPNQFDEEWQFKLKINSLFDSPGWAIYEERIKELITCEDSRIMLLTVECVKPEKLSELNFHIAKRNAYSEMLLTKEALLDEASEEMVSFEKEEATK